MENIFQKITAKKITAYQKRLAEELKLSPATVKRRLSSIRKFCEWAQKQGYLEENPFEISPRRSSLDFARDKHGFTTVQPATIRGVSYFKSSLSNIYKTYHSISITKYFHYALLIIFCAALGFGVYDQFFKKAPSPFAYPTSLTRPNRYLSFQGRLTDSSNNPISSATNIVFKLWKTSSAGTEGNCVGGVGEDCLWTSQTCAVTPDQDGIFSIILGTTSGNGYTCSSAIEIPATVFSENQNIY
ncbi:hypothetical protein COU95_02920, partial [Candidatus Shapirobacteria bacterium CG10_big_fil_rev_8_21_14_0_10_40_9]